MKRLAFYPADQKLMHEPPPQPRVPGFAKAKAKAATKKVITAILSEPLSSLAQSLPAISSQLAALQGRQDKMEALLTFCSLASGRLGKKGGAFAEHAQWPTL